MFSRFLSLLKTFAVRDSVRNGRQAVSTRLTLEGLEDRMVMSAAPGAAQLGILQQPVLAVHVHQEARVVLPIIYGDPVAPHALPHHSPGAIGPKMTHAHHSHAHKPITYDIVKNPPMTGPGDQTNTSKPITYDIANKPATTSGDPSQAPPPVTYDMANNTLQ